MLNLRPYQQSAISEILADINVPGNSVAVLPTGAGKSIVLAEIAHHLNRPILIFQPSKEILSQNLEKLLRYMPREDIGVYSASAGEKTIRKITLATIGSCYKVPELFQNFGLVLIDECFVGDTNIETFYGVKKIKDIVVGDIVKNKTGFGKVIAVSKKTSKILYKIQCGDNNFFCTPNHPIFTKRGVIEARHLVPNDILYTYAIQKNSKRLFSLWGKNNEYREKRTDVLFDEAFSGMDVREEKSSQFNVFRKKPYQNGGNIKENETQTSFSRGEWKKNTITRSFIFKFFIRNKQKMGKFLFCKNWEETKRWLSASLQNRHSASYKKNSSGNRWVFSWFTNKKRTGQKERKTFREFRLDSITILEQGCFEWTKEGFSENEEVYNFQVSGHSSYVANNILVHNCDLVPVTALGSMFMEFLEKINVPKVIGLTATPFRISTTYVPAPYGQLEQVTTIKIITRMRGKRETCFWSRIIFNLTTEELMEQGYLCRPVYYDNTKIYHSDIPLNKSASDYDLKAYEELILADEERILDTITRAQKVSVNVLVFCVSVEQAERFSKVVQGSAVVSALTPKKERESVINNFKSGKIKTVFNVQVFTVGFDFPALDTVVLIRPTKSLRLYSQMCGRGFRLAEGKTECKIIDFSGTVKEIGKAESIKIVKRRMWELESSKKSNWHGEVLYKFMIQK